MTRTRPPKGLAGLRGRVPARARLAVVAAASVAVGLAAGSLPASAAMPGSDLVLSGTVERFAVDDFGAAHAGEDHAEADHDEGDHDEGDHDELTFVRTRSGAVQVPTSALDHVRDGATVRVSLRPSRTFRVSAAGVEPTGVGTPAKDPEAGASVAAVDVVAEPSAGLTDTGSGTAAAGQTAAAAAPHSVLVVVATPSNGAASSVSASDVAATINGGVDTYWTDVTGGAVSFTATAYPSVVETTTTPCVSGSVGTSFDFWNEVKSKTGFTEGAGKHLLVYFRTLADCGGIAGLGTIGSDLSSGGLVWSNGYNTVGVLGHELGHNLSLGHSNTLDCTYGGSRVMDGDSTRCAKRSYTDTNDIMAVSWQNQGFLNASHLRYLGLLTGGSQISPSDNGQATLSPLASKTGLRAITLASGADRYVVEYRQPTGRDSWMSGLAGWGSTGVTVRKEWDPAVSGFTARESYLLDGDPSTSDSSFGQLYPTLPIGTWVDLAGGALGLRVISTSPTGAVVEYRNGAATTDPRYVPPPMPSLTVPSASLRAGAVTRTSSGPVVPVKWTWKVTAEDGSSSHWASSVRTGRATVPGAAWAYRATEVATSGTAVTTVGRTTGIYRTDAASANIRYSASMKKAYSSATLGGSFHRTYYKGGKVRISVTAKSVGLLLQRGPRNGWAVIYVDGKKYSSINLRAATTSTRVAWAWTFPTAGPHVITVINASSGSRGRLGFDGYVRL